MSAKIQTARKSLKAPCKKTIRKASVVKCRSVPVTPLGRRLSRASSSESVQLSRASSSESVASPESLPIRTPKNQHVPLTSLLMTPGCTTLDATPEKRPLPQSEPISSTCEVDENLKRQKTSSEFPSAQEVDKAASVILKEIAQLQVLFKQERHGGLGDHYEAYKVAENILNQKYEDLLPHASVLAQAADIGGFRAELVGDTEYLVAEFHGEELDDELSYGDQFEKLRKDSRQGFIRDAMMAAFALLACRRDKCWLEGYYLEKNPRGYFARALIDAEATVRFAAVRKSSMLRPVGLLVYDYSSLRDALGNMDSDGSLHFMPENAFTNKRVKAKLDIAFQHVICNDTCGDDEDAPHKEREHVSRIVPDPAIRDLLLNEDQKVLVLDVFTALAPRDVAKSEGLNAIVQAEFRNMLQKAKADGVAVIFHIGGSHLLVRKVYNREQFTQFGLKFGYVRWRLGGPTASWGKEQVWDNRACLGLQMP